jgi:6-pyruvoyltetrahydropterin/6-carboxytetrahydropterin synthase
MTRLSTIELFRDSLKFSAGHFTVFSSTNRENLHGHDYGVHACLTTRIEDEGLSFDYRFYEEKLYALCRTLDKKILIAELCKHLKINEENEYCCIHFNTEKIMLLKRDVKVLPIYNVTVEELSNWFLQNLLLDQQQLNNHRIQKIEIKIRSGLGRSGSSAWERS